MEIERARVPGGILRQLRAILRRPAVEQQGARGHVGRGQLAGGQVELRARAGLGRGVPGDHPVVEAVGVGQSALPVGEGRPAFGEARAVVLIGLLDPRVDLARRVGDDLPAVVVVEGVRADEGVGVEERLPERRIELALVDRRVERGAAGELDLEGRGLHPRRPVDEIGPEFERLALRGRGAQPRRDEDRELEDFAAVREPGEAVRQRGPDDRLARHDDLLLFALFFRVSPWSTAPRRTGTLGR